MELANPNGINKGEGVKESEGNFAVSGKIHQDGTDNAGIDNPDEELSKPVVATLFFSNMDEKYFERIGFNCAFDENENAAYEESKNAIISWLDEQTEELKKSYEIRLDNLNKRLEALAEQEGELSKRWAEHREEINDLEEKLKNIEEELSERKKLLSEKLIAFAHEKEHVVDKMIETVKHEMAGVTNMYEELVNKGIEVENGLSKHLEKGNAMLLKELEKEKQTNLKEWEHVVNNLNVYGFAIKPAWSILLGALSVFLSVAAVAGVFLYADVLDQLPNYSLVSMLGVLAVLTLTGVFYYYIRNNVEPRLLDAFARGVPMVHFELYLAAIMGFVAISLFAHAIVFPENVVPEIRLVSWLMLLLFFSYLAAFFFRLSLLHIFKKRIEKRLEEINKKIFEIANPAKNLLKDINWEKYVEKYREKLDELHSLMSQKMRHARSVYSKKDHVAYYYWWERYFLLRMVVKIGKYVVRRIRTYLWPVAYGDEVFYTYDNELLAQEGFKISEWEKVWFPGTVEELKQLRKKVAELEVEKKELNSQRSKIQTESSDYYLNLKSRVDQLKRSKTSYEALYLKTRDESSKALSLVKQFKMKVLYSLDKGFHVGLWYLNKSDNKAITRLKS